MRTSEACSIATGLQKRGTAWLGGSSYTGTALISYPPKSTAVEAVVIPEAWLITATILDSKLDKAKTAMVLVKECRCSYCRGHLCPLSNTQWDGAEQLLQAAGEIAIDVRLQQASPRDSLTHSEIDGGSVSLNLHPSDSLMGILA